MLPSADGTHAVAPRQRPRSDRPRLRRRADGLFRLAARRGGAAPRAADRPRGRPALRRPGRGRRRPGRRRRAPRRRSTWSGSRRTARATTLVGGTFVVTGAAVARGGARVAVVAARRRRRRARCCRSTWAPAPSTSAPTSRRRCARPAASRVPTELLATAPDGYPVHGWVVTPDPERLRRGPAPDDPDDPRRPVRAVHARGCSTRCRCSPRPGTRWCTATRAARRATAARTGCAIQGGFGTVDTDDVLALLGAALEDPRARRRARRRHGRLLRRLPDGVADHAHGPVRRRRSSSAASSTR